MCVHWVCYGLRRADNNKSNFFFSEVPVSYSLIELITENPKIGPCRLQLYCTKLFCTVLVSTETKRTFCGVFFYLERWNHPLCWPPH